MSDAPTGEGREAIRARIMATIPGGYSPWRHLAGTAGVGLVAIAGGLFAIHALRSVELLVVPIVLVLANAVEWRAHRNVLHRRWWPFIELYEQHTPRHHVCFQYADMAVRSSRELGLVLIPALGVAAIVAMAVVPSLAVGLLVTRNAGWLFLMTSAFYVVSYELSHLAYHLPPESFVGRLSLVRFLREHHARHHDPRLMQRWNFNVTLPLFDWLHGTIAGEEQLRIIAGEPPPVDAASRPAR